MSEAKPTELLPNRIVEAVWKHVQRYANGEIWMDTLRAEAEVKRLLRTQLIDPPVAQIQAIMEYWADGDSDGIDDLDALCQIAEVLGIEVQARDEE